jgi:hypothetical protein
MNVTDALEQIEAIHAQLAKGEEYRGYRPLALALSGLLGLLAAALQGCFVSEPDPAAFVRYWVLVALAAASVAGGGTVAAYLTHEDGHARRRTRTVIAQMLPSLLAGGVLTAALSRPGRASETVALLPGLWSLIYGLGTVASLPYLPRLAAAVAAWYLLAGAVLLWTAEGAVPSGWSAGLPFGTGQLLAAAILYRRDRLETQP